jgi:hypothetical protein
MMNTDNDVELIDIENKVNDVLIMRTGFHNRYISRCKVIGVKPLDKIINYVRPFADLDKETNKATFNAQVIKNTLSSVEGLQLLMKSFSGEYPGKVNTEELLSDRVHWSLVDLDSEVRKNLTRREEFIQVLELIHDLKTNKTAYVGDVAARKLEDISKTHEFETDIYRNLGIDKITSLDFNKTKIKAAMKKAKASFNK